MVIDEAAAMIASPLDAQTFARSNAVQQEAEQQRLFDHPLMRLWPIKYFRLASPELFQFASRDLPLLLPPCLLLERAATESVAEEPGQIEQV